MPKHDLHELIEFSDKSFLPKVLVNKPGYRLVLLNLRAGQGVPEHATKEIVTVYAISGHITFYDGHVPIDLRSGEVLQIKGGVPHRLDAHEDSSLLVVAAGNTAAAEKQSADPSAEDELDLRYIPRPERHPLVFAKFDALGVDESFVLVNDHDPFPLHRQMEAMRPGQSNWIYIEQGPGSFRIRIRRIAALNGSEESPSVPEALLGIQRT